MGKVVIGIHGLNNKPPRAVLKRWWKKSLLDGLWNIDRPRLGIKFVMVYWADILYPAPLDPGETDPNSVFFIDAPYAEYRKPSEEEKRDVLKLARKAVMKPLEKLMFNKSRYLNLDALGHFFIRKRFADLHAYYKHEWVGPDRMSHPLKEIVRAELVKILKRYRRHDILLLAHSMGSIVAYDVLTAGGPDIAVHSLVTFGSPLGNPLVRKEIAEEQRSASRRDGDLETPPGIVRRWVDIADPLDSVSSHSNLPRYYRPNAHGVQVESVSARNEYACQGVPSHHKLYGYVRTPECARIVDDFLNEGGMPWLQRAQCALARGLFGSGRAASASEAGRE